MLTENKSTTTQECRTYSLSDMVAILGVSMESVRNFLREHKEKKDFLVLRVGKHILVDKKSFEEWYKNSSNEF